MTAPDEDYTAPKPFPRILFMVAYGLLLSIARALFWGTVILQFIWTMVTSRKSRHLLDFGARIVDYIARVMQYLAYTSDERPFPFRERAESETIRPRQARKRLSKP